LNDKKPITPQYNRLMTFGVFGLVCALFYYVQKDVNHQVDTIKAQAAEAILAQEQRDREDPNKEVDIVCPRSRYEGATYYYSQYFEDYILDYVFSDVSKGGYIDVGAAEPSHWSVTHYFYEKGWRGINIDPMPSYVTMYKEERPDDIFLNVGISNTEGSLTLYDCGPGCGLSTFDKQGAEKVDAARKDVTFTEKKVPVLTMKQVLTKHPQQKIDFVNIDVEGWEKQVLESFDFNQIKPDVFIIESTVPDTTIPTQHLWENYLFDNGYIFAMTDFLNRYYVHEKSASLKKYFRRFSYIDMCVRQSKIRLGIVPTTPGQPFPLPANSKDN
jgi:FkbM family methyltransferase